MRYKKLSAKLSRNSHADLIAWLEQNDINVNQLIIHLLYCAMNMGLTASPPLPVEKPEVETVGLNDSDPIADIADFLDGI